MAIVTIKNDTCTAQIDSMGAQLLSMRFNGREYLWQRDERWWGRTSPILFPIVGNIRGGEAMSEQGPCHMKQHGVARNYEHRADVLGYQYGVGAAAVFCWRSPSV